MDGDRAEEAPSIEALVENQRALLRFLERRVGDCALAEDILQDAFARTIARPDNIPSDEEAVIPWFYRVLRNAAVDQFRRRGAATRGLEAFTRELDAPSAPAPDTHAEICACVTRLADTLKPEYAQALHAIEIEGIPVKTFAEREGLTANNAGVRIFRARDALKRRVAESCGVCAEHGCMDCTCKHTSR